MSYDSGQVLIYIKAYFSADLVEREKVWFRRNNGVGGVLCAGGQGAKVDVRVRGRCLRKMNFVKAYLFLYNSFSCMGW